MRLNIICSFIVLFCINASASWVKESVVLKVDTKVHPEISTNLPFFPAALNALSAENLASDSKVTVQQLRGEIANYRWENDSACKIPDPSKVEPIQLKQSFATFVYASDPQDPWGRQDQELILGTPCDKVTLKTSFKKTR